ncbi:MAG: hypothetical protein GXN91_01780, partial [Epsilonproteobacteria bacterium]|nr:hypothetical protein [Campylobacterota bacterium]
MKLYEIKAIKDYLKQFDFIKRATRVANNIIELNFNKDTSIYFDLTRGESTIYKTAPSKRVDFFNAPFDTKLNQLLSHSKIIDIVVPEDKVIIFKVKPQSKYKEKVINARFELTGKYTNMILTDENNMVIEALHHIDSSKSYREVKPGVILKELPPFKSKFTGVVEDVEALLEQNYKTLYNKLLERAKTQKLNIISKKIEAIKKALFA